MNDNRNPLDVAVATAVEKRIAGRPWPAGPYRIAASGMSFDAGPYRVRHEAGPGSSADERKALVRLLAGAPAVVEFVVATLDLMLDDGETRKPVALDAEQVADVVAHLRAAVRASGLDPAAALEDARRGRIAARLAVAGNGGAA